MKTFEFVVHGPFDIPIFCDYSDGQLDRYEFWRGSGELRQLARQSGCYVFALESTKGNITPAYVGLTHRGFSKEVFNPSNLRKYCRALRDARRRSPVLFLIVHPSAKGNVSFLPIVRHTLPGIGGQVLSPEWGPPVHGS